MAGKWSLSACGHCSFMMRCLEQLQPYQAGILDLTFDQEGAARFSPWAEEDMPKKEETSDEDTESGEESSDLE